MFNNGSIKHLDVKQIKEGAINTRIRSFNGEFYLFTFDFCVE